MAKLWDGTVAEIQMTSFTLPSDKMTHNNLKRSINDAGLGCSRILSAHIQIYNVYGLDYTQWNRSISLNEKQCQEACTTGVLT